MRQVNIYVCKTQKSPRRQDGMLHTGICHGKGSGHKNGICGA